MHRFGEGVLSSHLRNGPIATRTSENSTDLERGAAPRSIGDEFLEVRVAIDPLERCEDKTPSQK